MYSFKGLKIEALDRLNTSICAPATISNIEL